MGARVRYRISTKNGLFKKNAVFMKYNAVDEIYSYDKDFAVIEGINRAEP